MSIPQPRPPTKAQLKNSPLIELSQGSLYPYWDLQTSGLTPYLNMIRRAFGPLNPFSHQQVPTSQRMAVGIRKGPTYYKDSVYPHGVHFDSWYPSHYDPFSSTKFKTTTNIKHGVPPSGKLNVKQTNIAPKFCQRVVQNYKTCMLANDSKEQVCKEEQDNIVGVCPTFVLNNMKQKKLLALKLQAMANQKYRNVMSVSSYNEGRTIADIPNRSWQDGNRHNLRPNTLWADDRYADVTYQQVLAARERVKKRREQSNYKIADLPKYDRTYEAPQTKVPLYSL